MGGMNHPNPEDTPVVPNPTEEKLNPDNLADTQPVEPSAPLEDIQLAPTQAITLNNHPAGLEVTQPTNVLVEPANNQPAESPPAKPVKTHRLWPKVTLIGLLIVLVIAGLSGYLGMKAGVSQRQGAEATRISQTILEQYQLGLEDLANHQYFTARQRFEYVIQLDPNYPGVTEKLAETLLALNTTATPTLLPTPTVSPTPDLRGVAELFSQGQQAIANSDWENAINVLLQLRKTDPNYNMVQVDDMLFLALRNRGYQKIIKQADLEGGIYDLTLAKKFGPLDAEASGLLEWASLYITGASFWQIDWQQAITYFEQVANALPNLTDKAGMTALERYRQALIAYGNELMEAGEACDAAAQFELAYNLSPDPEVEQSYQKAAEKCDGGNAKSGDNEKHSPTDTPAP